MTLAVGFRPEAETELAEAVDWYEAHGRGLGAEFLRVLDATLAVIRRNPAAYPVVHGGARRAVLRRFPYSLIYTLDDREILIVSCFHGRRDPRHWQRRL